MRANGMWHRALSLCAASLWLALFLTGIGYAQTYPTRPIRIYTADPASSADFACRLIAQGISGPLGQQVIVENRGALLAVTAVVKAPPDGYSIVVSGSVLWLGPMLQKAASWDPQRDFSAITTLELAPTVLVVSSSVPAKTVKDLIALAKSRPGQLNYGMAGYGGASHLATELFNSMAGIKIAQIPYKGTPEALVDLTDGRLDFMFVAVGSVAPLVKSGKVRAVAVSSANPSALVPDLPTIAATVPGYESASILPAFAPAGTPAAIINRLNQEIVKVIKSPEVRDKFFTAGLEVVGNTPAEATAQINAEIVRMGKMIKDTGIQMQ